MCYFLTISVPARRADAVAHAFAPGFRTHPTTNPALLAALPPGYAPRLLTRGTCSCDLYSAPQRNDEANPEAHLRRKYAQRGWSESKITRAVEQARAAGATSLRPRGLRPDVAARLTDLCRSAGGLAVLVHWYAGDVETEPLSPTPSPPCDCDNLPARLATLSEDELLLAAP